MLEHLELTEVVVDCPIRGHPWTLNRAAHWTTDCQYSWIPARIVSTVCSLSTRLRPIRILLACTEADSLKGCSSAWANSTERKVAMVLALAGLWNSYQLCRFHPCPQDFYPWWAGHCRKRRGSAVSKFPFCTRRFVARHHRGVMNRVLNRPHCSRCNSSLLNRSRFSKHAKSPAYRVPCVLKRRCLSLERINSSIQEASPPHSVRLWTFR